MREKLFVGSKVRVLRENRGWKLEACARRLGVSISYLSQIEANQRPVTPRILVALVETFETPAATFDAQDDQRLISDLREVMADAAPGEPPIALSELRQVARHAPGFARRFLDLHRAYHQLDERLKMTDQAISLDESIAASSLLPYEEVRDFFHFQNNYIHELDLAAEALAEAARADGVDFTEASLADYLHRRLGVTVALDAEGDLMRAYDPKAKRLSLNPAQPPETRAFQMVFHLVSTELAPLVEAELARAGFRSRQAVDVCRIGLGNYAAGALLMPYRRFASAARALRHDVEQMARTFHTSLEQVCHRLSTLQRPGERGVPFYFVRLDHAGNITKRHSATRFRFARFGGACPLWNVHDAVSSPERFLVQVAEMPDGERYLCVARSVVKPSGSFLEPDRRYVLGFGCELQYADQLVYSAGVDLAGPPIRIGVSCRICERDDCAQRAFPPLDRKLEVPVNSRAVVPFRLGGG